MDEVHTTSGESVLANMVDVEEELLRFIVRSRKPRTEHKLSTSRNYKTEIDIIPLLVKDIHLLTLPDRSFSESITAYGLPFASALIYGRMSTTGAGSNGKVRYCLDDGTGVIQVRLLKLNSLKNIGKLDLQCFRIFGSNKELYTSVENILKTSRKQLLDVGPLPYGTKALLIGRPHRLYEEVVFSVFEIIIDTAVSSELEISVKNFIIDWYTNQYTGRQLKDPSLRT